MPNESIKGEGKQNIRQVVPDTAERVEVDTYDRGIVPAETAARKEREGAEYKKHPTEDRDMSQVTDDQTDPESVRTDDGYTVDREGLVNNYAIEPEMYYEVPGDARAKEEAEKAARAQEYEDVNEESDGKLRGGNVDTRGHGPGAV